MLFHIAVSAKDMWDCDLTKSEGKLRKWFAQDIPLAGKVTIVNKIVAESHAYYSSCLFPTATS